jgi:NAD-dependent DNA ligase
MKIEQFRNFVKESRGDEKFPELKTPDSPTRCVGAEPLEGFESMQ